MEFRSIKNYRKYLLCFSFFFIFFQVGETKRDYNPPPVERLKSVEKKKRVKKHKKRQLKRLGQKQERRQLKRLSQEQKTNQSEKSIATTFFFLSMFSILLLVIGAFFLVLE
jgi:hypothetical protein